MSKAVGQLPAVRPSLGGVGLKRMNDTHGHAAGDELLRVAVATLRRHVRPYDLVVRVGGDEFLCAMSGATHPEARGRFAAVAEALRTGPVACELKVGFAELSAEGSVDELMARADADALARRPRS